MGEPNVVLSGDPNWIERIILNLIDNAIKFTRPGGHVWITVTKSSNDAVFEIADDGIGIPAEGIPRIFERFYRADPSRANRADGAGLGLSLVKWAVDQHKGSVQVESTPGKGSRFIVKIPLTDRSYSYNINYI
jgi:signal transduction histidine kinase